MTARELHNIIAPLFPDKYLVINASAYGEKDYYNANIYTYEAGTTVVDWDVIPLIAPQSDTPEALIAACRKMAEGEKNESSETQRS